MKRILMTGALALTLATTPLTAKPAAALEPGQALGALFGVAVLAAIAGELDRDKDQGRKHGAFKNSDAPHRLDGRNHDWRRYDPRRHDWQWRKTLPRDCLRVVETRRDRRMFLGAGCLQRRDIRIAALPRDCEYAIHTRGGVRHAYEARCLSRRGYRIENFDHRYGHRR